MSSKNSATEDANEAGAGIRANLNAAAHAQTASVAGPASVAVASTSSSAAHQELYTDKLDESKGRADVQDRMTADNGSVTDDLAAASSVRPSDSQCNVTGTPRGKEPKGPSTPEQDDSAIKTGGGMGSALGRLFECLVQEWTIVEDVQTTADSRGEKRVFALIRQKTSKQKSQASSHRLSPNSPADRYDYENKYPEDAEGEGWAENARVWRVYLDEASHFDTDMVENIRDTVDVILVFAGLFSAVVSTLVGQASNALQPDYAQVTAALLMELIAVQRAMVAGTVVGVVFPSTLNLESPSTASGADRWVNGLWFVSLAFGLATALLSVLVKQWIQAYVAPTFGTPHFQSRVRHFRYMGMENWHVPLIVGMLPVLLHLALFLFFAGLTVLLFTLDHIIASFVTVIGSIAYSAYLCTIFLPVWYPQCPYKTPLSRYIHTVVHVLSPISRRSIRVLQQLVTPLRRQLTLLPNVVRIFDNQLHQVQSAFSVLSDLYITGNAIGGGEERDGYHEAEQPNNTLQAIERAAVHARGDHLDAHMLSWLCDISTNPSVGFVAAAAVSDLPIGFSALTTLRDRILPQACNGFCACFAENKSISRPEGEKIKPGMERKVYVYLQAHIELGSGRSGNLSARHASASTAQRESEILHHRIECNCVLNRQLLNDASLLATDPRLQVVQFLGVEDYLMRSSDYEGESQVVPTAHAHELRQLYPPATTSKRIWILLLQKALLAGLKSPSTQLFNLKDDAETLRFFLSRFEQSTLVMPTHALDDHALYALKDALLSAYLCQWTLPPQTTLKHHHLLRAAMDHDRSTMVEWYTRHQLEQSLEELKRYYHVHCAMHMLVHYARASHQEGGGILYVATHLEEAEHGGFLPLLDWIVHFDAEQNYSLPDDHPIYDQLSILIPTPEHMRALLHEWTGDPLKLIRRRVTIIVAISNFFAPTFRLVKWFPFSTDTTC